MALVIVLLATLPQFRTAANMRNVLQQNSVIGIIACAMTFAIISGGFDLSVGAGAALASVVGARLMIEAGIPLGIVGALVAGLAARTAQRLPDRLRRSQPLRGDAGNGDDRARSDLRHAPTRRPSSACR